MQVRVLLFADPAKLTGDAALNYRVLAASGVPILTGDLSNLAQQLSGAAWIVDACSAPAPAASRARRWMP